MERIRLPRDPSCAPQPVAVGRDRPRTRENTASQGPPSTARARRGRFLGSGTNAKVDGKTRGNQANSTPKTTTSSEARKAECWFSHGNSHIGPSGGPPGPPSLIRKFTTLWRTWASETTCFTVRIKIASSGSLRAVPGGPRRLLEAPRAPPPARGAVRSRKHSTLRDPEQQSDVLYGVLASPMCKNGPNPRGNTQRAAGRHGVAMLCIQPPK